MPRVRRLLGAVAIVVGAAEAVPYTSGVDTTVVGHRSSDAVEAFTFAPAASSPVGSHALAQGGLLQLRGVDELKSWFNAYKGHPRLIFLVSPT
jgi:hypothetical protein